MYICSESIIGHGVMLEDQWRLKMLFISSCLTRQICHYRVYHYIRYLMCILTSVASVPVRAKCYVSPASEDSGRAKIGARPPVLSHFCSLPNFRATRIFTSTQHISLRSHGKACYEGYVYSGQRTRPHVFV